jgi:transketolase
MAYGELGPTHHSIEDLSWTRAIANLAVAVPADRAQTRDAVRWAASAGVPCYLRIPRFKVPDVTPEGTPWSPGNAVRLTDGDDATVIATGTMVSRALEAAETLAADGIRVRVLNFPFVDPLDEQAVIEAAAKTGAIVTVEEATVSGGLGAAVASVVVEHAPVPMRILGIRDAFAPTGNAAFLLDHFGLNAAGIVRAVRDLTDRRAA